MEVSNGMHGEYGGACTYMYLPIRWLLSGGASRGDCGIEPFLSCAARLSPPAQPRQIYLHVSDVSRVGDTAGGSGGGEIGDVVRKTNHNALPRRRIAAGTVLHTVRKYCRDGSVRSTPYLRTGVRFR
jgi:hypothetical protein